MRRDEILVTASQLVTGDRQEAHGNAEDTYEYVAFLWNAYLAALDGAPLKADEVMVMMALMKIGRSINKPKGDDYIDACGYIGLAGELRLKRDQE